MADSADQAEAPAIEDRRHRRRRADVVAEGHPPRLRQAAPEPARQDARRGADQRRRIAQRHQHVRDCGPVEQHRAHRPERKVARPDDEKQADGQRRADGEAPKRQPTQPRSLPLAGEEARPIQHHAKQHQRQGFSHRRNGQFHLPCRPLGELYPHLIDEAGAAVGDLLRHPAPQPALGTRMAARLRGRCHAQPDAFFRQDLAGRSGHAPSVPQNEDGGGETQQRLFRQLAHQQGDDPGDGIEKQDVAPPEQEIVQHAEQ